MTTTRRQFIARGALMTGAFLGLKHHATSLFADQGYENQVPAYGPLHRDPGGLLDLPEGFEYRVLSRTGDPMADGLVTPGGPDGMAAFAGPGRQVILVRNHELTRGSNAGAFGDDAGLLEKVERQRLYDLADEKPPHLGGTTTLVYDPFEKKVIRQYLSLAGTCRNCAGGPTPWNSWITCEETMEKAGGENRLDHGYNFEVPAGADPHLTPAVPLKAMGRFNHEAVAVDPRSGVVYQTEDRGDGLFYRYVPNEPGNLQAGGRLQALVVADLASCDTRNWDQEVIVNQETNEKEMQSRARTFLVGEPVAVRWVDMEEIEAPNDDLRYRGHLDGAAVFARGEGAWYGNESVYFACTNGGPRQCGQVFRYRPSPYEGTALEATYPGSLELFAESPGRSLLEYCDNLTVAPWGDVILSEDGSQEQYIRGLTQEGKLYTIGRNRLNGSEFAGVCFAPNHPTLFVNIQNPGITFAITGPWHRMRG